MAHSAGVENRRACGGVMRQGVGAAPSCGGPGVPEPMMRKVMRLPRPRIPPDNIRAGRRGGRTPPGPSLRPRVHSTAPRGHRRSIGKCSSPQTCRVPRGTSRRHRPAYPPCIVSGQSVGKTVGAPKAASNGSRERTARDGTTRRLRQRAKLHTSRHRTVRRRMQMNDADAPARETSPVGPPRSGVGTECRPVSSP